MKYLGMKSCPVVAGPDDKTAKYAKDKSYGKFYDCENIEMIPDTTNRSHIDVILESAKLNQGKLVIVGIGPLTPLADAIDHDTDGVLSKVAAVYLQGTVHVKGKFMKPHWESYNFDQD